MYLGKIAERWVNEPLDVYDEASETFVSAAFTGRISLTDRFLSNFNRPLRRRMLHYSPDTEIPASYTIRHPDTGDVYLIGQRREDTNKGTDYHAMAVCHMVTDEGPNSSAGLATITRKVPQGPADDPDWLVETEVGRHFIDIEFRSSLNDADLHQSRIEAFVMWIGKHVDLRDYDFMQLHGHEYRVTDVYPDSGFLMARINQEGDYRVDLVVEVGEERVYDEEQMRWTTVPHRYNVTMLLDSNQDFGSWVSDSEDYIDLSVQEDHIGFKPEPGMVIEYQGRKRTIRQSHYYRGERQYKLRAR